MTFASPPHARPAATPRADLLTGCSIVELSTRAAGAYAGRLLALLGAEVVRLDLPSAFDCRPVELPLVLASLHEHKRIVDADDDRAVAQALGSCDLVLVDSSRDDAAGGTIRDRLATLLNGLGPDVHVVESPSLDPRRSVSTGSSLTACADAAMTWAIGDPSDTPLTLPFDVPDYLGGTETAAAAALALLTTPRRTGQRWSVPVSEVVAYYVGQISSNFIPYERPWHRDGARATMSGGSYPAAMFQCKDGWVSVMCRTQVEWHGLVAALDRPDWLEDERFSDSRVVARHHADALDPIVTEWCRQRTRQEVFEAGRLHEFPVAPVSAVPDVLGEEQFDHRKFFVGEVIARPGSPFKVIEPDASDMPARQSFVAEPGRGPLSGLRVLDLAWVWSGPMVTAALADLGADVIKIESRRRPDPSRLRGRAYRNGHPLPGPALEVTPYHNQMNRGKRSIEIDLSTDEGAALVRRLSAQCDVVVENMRPGVLKKRGLDYASLSKDNPSLVMLSLSMLGQTGPLSGIRGYAVVMSGLAGLDSLVGYDQDRLIGTFNPALGDPNGAAHGLTALLAALYRRQKTGRGAWIDVSQVEALLAILHTPIARAQTAGVVTPPANTHAAWWPHGIYPCAGSDEWVAIAARNLQERTKLARWCELGDSFTRQELENRLPRWTANLRSDVIAEQLAQLGVPAAPVATYESLRDRDTFDLVDHPWLGPQPLFGLPWQDRGNRLHVQNSSPALGADTDGVLNDLLGIPPEDIAALRARGVLGAAS